MNTRITHDGTMETVYDDESLQRAHIEPTTQTTENPAYSPTILKIVKKMREGSITDNNKRSQQIVKAQKKEMKKMDRKTNKAKKKATKVVKPPAKPVQRTIADFGGN